MDPLRYSNTSTPVQTPFPNPSNPASLPSHHGSLNIPFIAENVKLPQALQDAITGALRQALDKCNLTAAHAIQHLRIIYRERDQRYRRLCPMDPDPVRYLNHVSSIDRLRAWKETYGCGPGDLILAPTAKLPRAVIKLFVDRNAYERWARGFNNSMAEFVRRPYSEYRSAIGGFEKLMNAARGGEGMETETTALPTDILKELWKFWEGRFLPEMRKWEVVLFQLKLPSYGQLVGEITEALLESVEGPEEDTWI